MGVRGRGGGGVAFLMAVLAAIASCVATVGSRPALAGEVKAPTNVVSVVKVPAESVLTLSVLTQHQAVVVERAPMAAVRLERVDSADRLDRVDSAVPMAAEVLSYRTARGPGAEHRWRPTMFVHSLGVHLTLTRRYRT